jgi:cation diffusion facilitator family transporter
MRGLSARRRVAYIEGFTSIVVNTFLFVVKYVFGVMYSSIAVLADSIHTLSDSATSVVLVLGFYLASKPADEEHPFGHGRFEIISALVIGVLLGVVAVEFMRDSVEKLVVRASLVYSDVLVAVLVVSTLVKAWLGIWAYRLSVKYGSEAIKADAWHHNSDALATGLLALAIFVGREYWWIDGALGMLISLAILITAGRLVYESSTELLGRAPLKIELDRLKSVVKEACPEIENIHHIHFHRYGDHVEVTLHVTLRGDMPLREAHEIASRAERTIKKKLGYEATVHVEPLEHEEREEH